MAARCWIVLAVVLAAGRVRAEGPPDADMRGRRIKVTGHWTGAVLDVSRVQYRDGQKDPGRGRVAGRIEAVSDEPRGFRIGPITVVTDAATHLEDIEARELVAGRTVEVDGTLVAPARLLARNVAAVPSTGAQVEVLGLVTFEELHPDDTISLVVLGVPALVPANVSTREVELTRRLDERRPAEQLTVSLFGRPVTIGGQLESNTRWFRGTDLEPGDDDELKQEFELKPELYYPITPNALLFLQAKAVYEGKFKFPEEDQLRAFERGETWLYLGNTRRGHFSTQIGRQNFREPHEWWWDQDLDALRVYYDRARVHLESAVAYEVASVTTEEQRVEASEQGVLRFLGNAAWGWRGRERLDAFVLYQHDLSGAPRIGTVIADDREDESDADLTWLGGRASGRVGGERYGELDYGLDVAWVWGRERLVEFDDADIPDHSIVVGKSAHDVRGVALDTRATWLLPVHPRVGVTLGYAYGARDFQQTGLERNKDRFRGVDRFAYYGTLLRPELANLHVATVAVGWRFLPSSSIELLYHAYRQADASDELRDADVDTDPNGKDAFLGQEWDAVLGMREWEHVDLELIGSVFRAGPAYGDHAGRLASGVFLKLRYSF